MKLLLIFAVTITVLIAYAFSHITAERRVAAQQEYAADYHSETQFFCDRTALTLEQRKRHQELVRMLASSIRGIHVLGDGLEFGFSPDATHYQALTELTPLERACCPFFDISIRLERNGGKLWWRLTGLDGVKQFIRAEFSSWIKR